jgi:hypothetical protein
MSEIKDDELQYASGGFYIFPSSPTEESWWARHQSAFARGHSAGVLAIDPSTAQETGGAAGSSADSTDSAGNPAS